VSTTDDGFKFAPLNYTPIRTKTVYVPIEEMGLSEEVLANAEQALAELSRKITQQLHAQQEVVMTSMSWGLPVVDTGKLYPSIGLDHKLFNGQR
jgi:hypothetical protein